MGMELVREDLQSQADSIAENLNMRATRVEVRGVTKTFWQNEQQVTALNNMSFTIANQEFVSIVGPSGCGKSTVLRLISGLDFPTDGEVLLDGQSVTAPSHRVGFMLQKDLLLPWRTVLENVTIGLEIRGVQRAERNGRARELIHKYGLAGFEASYPRHLSGGMRQRVAIARTLAVDPEILLLDEPLSALDFQTKLKMQEELINILRSDRKTVLLITHDIEEALSISDRVFVCSSRPARVKTEFALSFVRDSNPRDVRSKPEFRDYFNAVWQELEGDIRI